MRLKEKIFREKEGGTVPCAEPVQWHSPTPSLPSWARVTVNGVSNGHGVSSLVCGASGYRENAKGALKSCDRYFIMNSKDQSQGSSLLQGLFLEIL